MAVQVPFSISRVTLRTRPRRASGDAAIPGTSQGSSFVIDLRAQRPGDIHGAQDSVPRGGGACPE